MAEINLVDIAARAVELARAHGADAADAVLIAGESTRVSVRNGETEEITRAENSDLGLRVFAGSSQAIVSSTRFADDELKALAERAMAMARLAPPDPDSGLAEPEQLCQEIENLDLADDATPTTDDLLRVAIAADASGIAVEGVSASSGSGANAWRRSIVMVASNGFAGAYERTGYGISSSMIGGAGTAMERDYDYRSAVKLSNLPAAEEIGEEAGRRVVRRLNPRKARSAALPVVYEQRIASSLMSHLAGAINGAGVARGTSFLKDSMDEQVFAADISVIDDARLPGGFGSKPFDGEGLATGRREVVSNGMLKAWLLDLHSARKLGLHSTGNAARGTSGAPSPSASNFDLQPGAGSPEELIADIKEGLLVSELIGMGVNGTTGDYSRGATGFWIDNGEIAYPVSEITIAGNLKAMFANLTPANDLVIRGSINAPTCRVEGLTIAGV